jgi:hypothetical protein
LTVGCGMMITVTPVDCSVTGFPPRWRVECRGAVVGPGRWSRSG